MKAENKRRNFTWNLFEGTVAGLTKLSKKDGRSLTNYIQRLFDDHINTVKTK